MKYSLPIEPAGPLWTTDETGAVTRWTLGPPAAMWISSDDHPAHTWHELLALGPDDQHPTIGAWPFPWTARTDDLANARVLDSNGSWLFRVDGLDLSEDEDVRLAALIVKVVNEWAAGQQT